MILFWQIGVSVKKMTYSQVLKVNTPPFYKGKAQLELRDSPKTRHSVSGVFILKKPLLKRLLGTSVDISIIYGT